MKLIKIGIRNNLFYPMMTIIFTFSRSIISIILEKKFSFNNQTILALIMFISEFISGIIFYQYQKSFLSIINRRNIETKSINSDSILSHATHKHKKYILILACSFFDFSQFYVISYHFIKLSYISKSINYRLRSLLILCSAFFCYFLLKTHIYKHQIFSLIIIFICFVCVCLIELFIIGDYKDLLKVLLLNVIRYIFSSILEVTEKYLFEYESLNPLFVLMIEGIYGSIITLIFSLTIKNPFIQLKIINDMTIYNLILFIILLICYFIFSGGRNIYRLITNKIYSPMAKSLTDYFFVPLLIIFYYFIENDFQVEKKGKQSLAYFLLNIFVSIITVFCSCIYNELFVLYCCRLEYNTYYEVSRRASVCEYKIENNMELNIEKQINLEGGYYYNLENESE